MHLPANRNAKTPSIMLKLVLSGLWVALVTGVSAYFAPVLVTAESDGGDQTGSAVPELVELKTEMTSVPMVRGGEVLGYVIIQLSYSVNKQVLEKLKIEPQPYLVDAAFRGVFSSPQTDFRRVRASELDALTEKIATEANRRLGSNLVQQVLIQQLNYVRKEDIRTNWIGKKPASN